MAVVGGKYFPVTFCYDETDLLSEGIRLALAEKEIDCTICTVKNRQLPEDMLQVSSSSEPPLMIDRELVLSEHFIMMEYLDERFPHPPLLPVYPVSRAEYRSWKYRLQQLWYGPANFILAADESSINDEGRRDVEAARKVLRESIVLVFQSLLQAQERDQNKQPFFMSDSFSLLDCMVAPIIFNLPKLGLSDLSSATMKLIEKYKKTLWTKESVRVVFSDSK
jgi:RNA polymerase-associated protein